MTKSNRFFCIFIVTAFSFLSSYTYAEYAVPLKIDQYTDAFLYRTACRYGIELPKDFFCQPMNALEVNKFIAKLDSLDARKMLSPEESFSLSRLKQKTDNTHAIFKWKDTTKDISGYIHLKLPGEFRTADPDSIRTHIKGMADPSLQGNIGKLSYFGEIEVWTDYESDTLFKQSDYEPYNGVPYNLFNRASSSHLRASDLPRGGIYYYDNPISAGTSIDRLRQGPAIYNPLTFSGNSPPETYFRAWMDMGIAEYTHTFGLLQSETNLPKYFYTHRLDFSLFKNQADIGLSEVIIGGSTTNQPLSPRDSLRPEFAGIQRTWEWGYMIPFVPFKFVEHFTGDLDNAAIAIDGNLTWPKNFRWYGELFIDDLLSPVQFWTNDWGNKWAYTVGMQYFGRSFTKDITTGIEYCRIEPWVYTHIQGGADRYDNFNVCLGSPLGPNAEQLHIDLAAQVSKLNNLGISLVYTAKDTARGSNITDVHQDSTGTPGKFYDSTRKVFLGPGSHRSVLTALTWKFNPFGIFMIDAQAGYDTHDKFVVSGSGWLNF